MAGRIAEAGRPPVSFEKGIIDMSQLNPMKLLQLKASWEQFKIRHPRLSPFLGAVSAGALREGTVIEVTVSTADGKKYSSNLKLSAEDIRLMEELKELSHSM